MNLRETFLNYVKNGGEQICSPQIGAGAGFDSKMVGKEWISETTLEDTLETVGRFDIVPLINVGLCDLGGCNPLMAWREVASEVQDDRTVKDLVLDTPKGVLHTRLTEEKRKGAFRTRYPVQGPSDLEALEYYIDAALDSDLSAIESYTRDIVTRISGRGALSVQWAAQPYEMLCFPDTVNTVLLANDCEDVFRRLMDKIQILDSKIIESVAKGGADFIFLGGPGSEMISPRYYEDFIIPYSQQVSDMAHSNGLLVYSHICSPIEPFLTMGFYNRMGIDLFETLSPKPVGNIISLPDALSKIDPHICTRGNLGLDILTDSSPEEVRLKTEEIIEASRGRKHIVAASDYLFYQTPEENVRAMANTVKASK